MDCPSVLVVSNNPPPIHKNAFLSSTAVFAPDLSVCLIRPDCRDPNPTIIEDSERGISCVRAVGWSLATVLFILRASGGYVLPYSSYVLASSSPVFPKTLVNDEGNDPSRVGAATDPLMEGMEQLDTIIGFKDGGTGIARELQRAATRSRENFFLHSATFPASVTNSYCPKRSATSTNNSTSA